MTPFNFWTKKTPSIRRYIEESPATRKDVTKKSKSSIWQIEKVHISCQYLLFIKLKISI